MMKRCIECGSNNADHSFVCVVCGVPMEAEAQQPGDGHGYTGDTDQIPPQPGESPEQLLTQASDVLAEGNSAEAVRLCRCALALDPGLLEAYSLLGMAYEEIGDQQAALEAYEEVLRIDPSRAAERQKVSLLRLQLVRRDIPAEADEAVEQSIWIKHAPIIFAAAATLLAFVILTSVYVGAQRARRTAEMEDGYRLAMEAGNAAMADGQYAKAITHFEAALQLKPEDTKAEQRIGNARDRLTMGTAGAPSLPKYIGQNPHGPNPFRGAVIPPTNVDADDDAEMDASLPVPPPTSVTSSPPRSVGEPVWGTSRTGPAPTVGGAQTGSGETAAAASAPRTVTGEQASGGPINPRNTPKPLKSNEFAPAETLAHAPEGPPPEGSIRIWSEGSTASRSATSAPKATQSTPSANPDQLREQAAALSRQGRNAEAISTYNKAIDAYQQRAEQQPQLKAATQSSIGACEAARDMLQGSQ